MTGPERRWLPIAATAVLAFLGGLAIGGHRVSASVSPAGADTSAVATDDGPDEAPLAIATTTANERDEAGAVRAAVLLATAFDGLGLLDDDRRAAPLAAHAADDHRDELDRNLGDVARLIRDELDVDAADLDGPEFVWRAIPAGVRVESFTTDNTVVAVWGTGVVIARGLPLVQPGWRTTRVEMVWERDG